MNKLVRSKERQRSHGEVFTPDFLVERMLDMVPEEVWRDPSRTFLEPSCGSGNFVVAIVRRKVKHGSTVDEALSTTYGVDIQEDNVLECRSRLIAEFAEGDDRKKEIILSNVRVGDFLKQTAEEIWSRSAEEKRALEPFAGGFLGLQSPEM